MDTSAWEAAGLYDPGSPAAAERQALLQYLTDRGATIEQMVEAERLDALPALAGELVRRRSVSLVTVEELAARCGASPETVQRILLAAGIPVRADTELSANLDALVMAFIQGVALMGEDAILAFTRVLGAAATNIAEAAVALFLSELGPGTEREGRDELTRAQISERATLAFDAVPEALIRVLITQFDRASQRSLSRGWTTETDEATLAASEVVTLGFVDLVGSTSWAERMSLRDQSLALSRFESAAWSSAVLAGGRVVKMIGDEAFFVAPSVDAGCRIATEVCRAAAEDGLLPEARGAVGHGTVMAREGDYFGPVVNQVARLVKVATPGCVVVTGDAAVELSTDRWSVVELDAPRLRGIDAAVKAFEIAPMA
ncbi:MAG: adenylate/guanylate cyclase domain-containing protein [Acidimicrobiales bacterium]